MKDDNVLNEQSVQSIPGNILHDKTQTEDSGATNSQATKFDQHTMENILKFIEQTQKKQEQGTLWKGIKEKLNQIGRSAMTTLVALTVAIVTPVILNSQLVQNIDQSISDIRSKLPTEEDKLMVANVFNETSTNKDLIGQLSQTQKKLLLASIDFEKSSNVFNGKYEAVLQNISDLALKSAAQQSTVLESKEKITTLEKQLKQMQFELSQKTNLSNDKLLNQLIKLHTEGESLTKTQITQAEKWFKKISYIVIGLQGHQTVNQLGEHVKILKAIRDKKMGFTSFESRQSEALLILSALSSLASSAML